MARSAARCDLPCGNLGGAVPGQTDMATQSNPAEYAYCIAESEDSPWDPLHVERAAPPATAR